MWQHPRYIAAKKNTSVHFICYTSQPHAMQWYKALGNGKEFHVLDQSSDRFSINNTNDRISFTISRISYEDNGIYVCDSKNLTEEKRQPNSCGTEIRVMSEWGSHHFHHFFLLFFFPPFSQLCKPYITLLCTRLSLCWTRGMCHPIWDGLHGFVHMGLSYMGLSYMGLSTWACPHGLQIQQWVLRHTAGGSLHVVCPSHRHIPGTVFLT